MRQLMKMRATQQEAQAMFAEKDNYYLWALG